MVKPRRLAHGGAEQKQRQDVKGAKNAKKKSRAEGAQETQCIRRNIIPWRLGVLGGSLFSPRLRVEM